MDFFNSCNTQDEAKKTFHLLVKHFHPDKGGDAKLMIELKKQYDSWCPASYKFNKTNWQNQFPDSYNDSISEAKSKADEKYIDLLEKRIEILNKKNDNLENQVEIYIEMNFFQRVIWVIFGDVYVKSKKKV